MADAPFEATRKVIDVSGDGVNNCGPPGRAARDRAVAEGITINGLPIVNDRPTFGRMPPVPLDEYYRESVVGGTGAFVIVAEDFDSFGAAVKRKLIREIAGLPGPGLARRATARPLRPHHPAARPCPKRRAASALHVLDRQAEGRDALGKQVAQHVHAHQVGRGVAALVAFGGQGAGLVPLLRPVVAAADPGERDQRRPARPRSARR